MKNLNTASSIFEWCLFLKHRKKGKARERSCLNGSSTNKYFCRDAQSHTANGSLLVWPPPRPLPRTSSPLHLPLPFRLPASFCHLCPSQGLVIPHGPCNPSAPYTTLLLLTAHEMERKPFKKVLWY